ncbi:zinc ribbon domain-containing protein [Streptosporangium soli]|nr:zinc ribbon domain-containing protein [Streptosporangium sp. KLBMP 9127]
MRPVPDRDSAEWWAAVRRRELAVQECAGCGTWRFPARAYCPVCRAREWRWRVTDGRARVSSWIVAHQRFHPALAPPYTVVRVCLAQAPGCVLYGTWVGGGEPVAGEPVRAVFTEVDEGLTLIAWEPAG